MGIALIAEQILADGWLKCGVPADLHLFVVDLNRTEIFGEAFVEPSLGRRIVVIQQRDGEVMRDRPPRFRFEQVERDEVLVIAREEKSGGFNGLSLMQWGQLVVSLVIFKGEDGQGARLVQALLV